MKSKYMLCWYILAFITKSGGQTSLDTKRISYLLEKFCPGDGLCLSNRTVEDDHNGNDESCCSRCSCHDDCYLSNCCFPQFTHNENITDSEKPSRLFQRSCIFPFTNDFEDQLTYMVETYYMVTSEIIDDTLPTVEQSPYTEASQGVTESTKLPMTRDGVLRLPKEEQNLKASEPPVQSIQACGDQVVAPWGSLYPVYSKEHDLIFKNSVCAKEFNVTDGVLWTPVILCQKYLSNHTFLNDAATFSIDADIMTFPSECLVYFQPPDHIKQGIESHVCYIEEIFIKTCPDTTEIAVMRPPYDMYTDEIMAACTSGLLSPYKYTKYANVFCYICNAKFFNQPLTCDKTKEIPKSQQTIFAFIGLLDVDLLFPDEKEKQKPRMACVMSHKVDTDESCREILCPSGKSRGVDGKCHFSSKKWYINEYTIMVNISSPHQIDTRSFDGNNISAMKTTWPKNWRVVRVFKETNITTVLYLLAYIKVSSLIENPGVILSEVKKVMKRQWGIYSNAQIYKLGARFAKFRSVPIASYRNENGTIFSGSPIRPDKYTRIYLFEEVFTNRHHTPFFITKLYYCEQVELKQDEFMLNPGNDVFILYNKLTDQYMYDAEFTLVNKGDFVVPRVCLDSSSGLEEAAGGKMIGPSNIWIVLASTLCMGGHQMTN